ncbi:MAG: hypothetical protein RIR48_3553 [Bacteroidota bacterium]
MEDKIKELTDKIYNEGVVKASEEAEKIISEATMKADEIISDAQKQAESIIMNAKSEAFEVADNIKEEIRHAGHQAINIVKQKIGDLITLSITEKPLSELVNDKQFILNTVQIMMEQWSTVGDGENVKLVLPESLEKEASDAIIRQIHNQFGKNMKVEFSHKMDSGFRIAPEGSNYVISFTEKEFTNFFSQFLRPKTISTLFGDAG